MVKEAYCSYEVAKLLKEKGFNEPCSMSYWLRTKDSIELVHLEQKGNNYSDCVYAPTHQMAMAFLREKGIYICPKYCCFCGSKKKDRAYYKWEARILRLPSNNIIYPQPMDMCKHYPTYEEAVEAALKYSLENLI